MLHAAALFGAGGLVILVIAAIFVELAGVVLHLNNLENLSGSDLQRAANTLQSLRNIPLMLDGLHVVLVGTTDALDHVVNANAQVRNVFRAPMVLDSLSLAQVRDLLAARYDKWRLDEVQPARPPVEDVVIERLWTVFRGKRRLGRPMANRRTRGILEQRQPRFSYSELVTVHSPSCPPMRTADGAVKTPPLQPASR